MIHLPTATWAHTAFDLAAWSSGAALSVVLYRWRIKGAVQRVAGAVDGGYFACLALGAVAGAFISGSLNTLREPAAAISHSIVGALVGAIMAVEIYKAMRGIRGSTGTIFVGSFSLGVVIGRFGCLFAGLPDRTYGLPTRLPWGVDLGDGVSRHPVQVYESTAMALFLAIYLLGLRARADWALRRGFYAMCAWYGAQRFAWEFLKPYPRLIGPFNLFHLICAGLVVYGCVYYWRDLDAQRASQERALPVPRADHQPV